MRAYPAARGFLVLRLVAEGGPNKLIARELGISEKTVKAHLTDRTEAALWAKRHAGLVVLRPTSPELWAT